MNLKDNFRQNFNLKKYYYFENLLNSFNFTLIDDRYFHIESLSSYMVTNYQLNYETRQKILYKSVLINYSTNMKSIVLMIKFINTIKTLKSIL
jgi:hypothetical protein